MFGNIGDLRPDDQTSFVAQIVKFLRVLIVREPYGIGAHFTNQVYIFFMMRRSQCIADFRSVLMAGNTA